MLCAIEVTDSSLQSTSHIPCNKSFRQTISHCLPKGQLIQKPFYASPQNRGNALTILPRGHDSDWIPAPLLSDIHEARVSSFASRAPSTEDLGLLSAQQGILYWSSQPNERNMHDQADSSKLDLDGNPHGGQSQHRKNVCDESTGIPPCHVVAKKSSRPVNANLRSDSNILHPEDNPPRKTSKKKGSKKRKLYMRATHKKLNSASENTCEENTYAASPVEVLPTDLLADKLSETTFSTRSLVKKTHLGKDGAENNGHVKYGAMVNLCTLGTDGIGGSAGSSNEASVESCRCVTYLNNGSNTIHASEFNGSTFAEHGLGEESNIYQKLFRGCVCNLDSPDTSFSKWNNDNSGNYSVNVEARLIIKDENRCNATHAEGTNDSFSSSSCCSKDVTDSSSNSERVQCSSEACSSKTSLQFKSGRSSRNPRKTPSSSDLTMFNRVVIANRHKNGGGKDSSAVWQKVEKGDKSVPTGGRTDDSPIQDKGAEEDTNKGIQQDATRHRAKRKQNKKACKQEFPKFEMESTKEEDDAFNSFQTSSKSVYKKQVPFLHQQRSSSFKQGSQSLKNYYAPKNGISKAPKDYSQQEGLPLLQLVQVKNTCDRSMLSYCSTDEVILTGIGGNCKSEGKENLQSGNGEAVLPPYNLVPDLVPQAASWTSRYLYADPCAAETEEARYAKLAIENNPQESCKLYLPSGHLSQKWVPVGKKEVLSVNHLDVSEASGVEGSLPANGISDPVSRASANGEDIKLASDLNSYERIDLKCQAIAYKGSETSYNKITESLSDVCIAWQRVEDVQASIGRPLADCERFMHSASPVMHCLPCPTGCKSYLQESVKDGLCLHQTSDITLRSVWQWYEEPGCYGLEVKAQDFRRSKGLWNSQCQFTTYFVPYLSAVQLFRQPKRTSGGSTHEEAVDMDMTREASPCLNTPPIFAKLIPQQSKPRNRSPSLHTEDDQHSSSAEFMFEYFESEQPYWRRQLFDKVNELIAGVKPLNCHMSGDPKNLELSMHDLHSTSWFCVAWYPIYRIPDGKFQAAFLTYHSLGHCIHRSSSADEADRAPVALPVIGLQSYNDKAEWWFQTSKSDSEDVKAAESQAGEASQVLKERLRTLNQAAGMMSRADVLKNGQLSRNRHPDYEFFLSRS